jgi:hypothetical protein
MYFKLNDGNQTELILLTNKDSKWIHEIIAKFSWDNYDPYENRLNAYMEDLFDPLGEELQSTEIDEEDFELFFWEKLTRGQKIFMSYLAFEGEVDNGGLFQFFLNKPHLAYSFLEVVDILNLNKLDKFKDDYLRGLQKYESIQDQIIQLQEGIDTQKDNWEDEYYEYHEKASELFGLNEIMEDYFYEDKFKKHFNKAMCDYIETHKREFIKE